MNWEELFYNNKSTDLLEVKKIIKNLDLKLNFKIIQVVGTNGKGSVSNYLNEHLVSSNFKTGLFTSPHLFRPNERIKINNEPISDSDFFRIATTLPESHFFSKVFLTSLIYFEENNIDVAIIEAGIGGERDITNSLDGDIGVLTSIGLDHMNLLGNTIQDIAEDKAGIINKGMKFYLPDSEPKDIKQIFINKNPLRYFVVNNKHESFKQRNKALASKILKEEFGINATKFKDVIGRNTLVVKNNINYIFDVGHNIYGIKESLKELNINKINYDQVIIAMQKKKDVTGIEKILENKEVFYYKPNDRFHDFKNFKMIKEIKDIKKDTLFIGSFIFIGEIYEKLI